jgi:hypothetical protein
MDMDRIQGSVEQAKGKVKEGVGKVTSDASAFLREGQRSLAVMCPGFLCGCTWTAGLDGFRGSRPYQLVGI